MRKFEQYQKKNIYIKIGRLIENSILCGKGAGSELLFFKIAFPHEPHIQFFVTPLR